MRGRARDESAVATPSKSHLWKQRPSEKWFWNLRNQFSAIFAVPMLARLTASSLLRRCLHGPSLRSAELAAGGGAAAAVWTQVNELAAKPGMINMGQGFPDFDGSPVARAAAAAAIEQGGAPLNQYSAQPGLPELRGAISRFYERRYGAGRGGSSTTVRSGGTSATYDPATEVVVTCGAQEALAAAFLAYLDVRLVNSNPGSCSNHTPTPPASFNNHLAPYSYHPNSSFALLAHPTTHSYALPSFTYTCSCTRVPLYRTLAQ